MKACVDAETRAQLAALARDADRSLASEVRRAVREYVERERERGRGGSP